MRTTGTIRPRGPAAVLAVLAAFVVLLAAAPTLGAQQEPGANPGAAGPDGPAAEEDPAAEEGVLRAVPLEGEVRIDGVLDEPAWASAPAASGFRQQEPDEGRPATQDTEVRVLYAPDRLVIGARMYDPEPRRILARILERDLLIETPFVGVDSEDDAFLVVLDTYDDDRNGFVFATNPNGAESDALLRGEGDLNQSWDGVWRVASSVGDAGWSTEIEIPLWTLRFGATPHQRWGVNFQRVFKRRNERSLWRSWTRDNGGLLKVSQAGALVGLAALDAGRKLELKPFALVEGSREELPGEDGTAVDVDDASVDAGLDAKLGVTPNLTLDATVNTDFAQVEADVRQINLTRFDLFFPEKREFFLEGAGIFTFGVPGFGGPPPLLLFFSRRIGLQEEVEVPILAGAKLTGKEGPWSLGFIDVTTDDEPEAGAREANVAVARVVRDVGARSTIGAMVTHKAEAGREGAAGAGVDTHVQFSQKLVFDGFLTATDTPDARGETAAYRAALDFTADTWGWLVEQNSIGPGYAPPVGFVLRDDIQRQFATFRVSPRPPVEGLRRVDLRLNATLVSDSDWDIRDRQYRLSLTPQLDSGDQLEVRVLRNFVRLVDPFALREDIVFPVGDYRGEDLEATLSTSRNRPVAGDLFAGTDAFFSGRLRFVGARLLVSANRHLSFEATWDHNDVETPHGDLATDLATLRVNYAFSTQLFTNALVQYDSESGEVDANVRVNLIHSPGSDLFVVLNARRGDEQDDLFDLRDRALVVKFTKLLTF